MTESRDAFDAMAPRYGDFYAIGSRGDLEYRLSRKLVLTARQWATLLDGTLKATTGQNRARWQTLFAVAYSEPPVTTLSLAERLSVQWPTIVRTLTALEKEGLVARRSNPQDGRSRLLELTRAGQEMLTRIQPVIDPLRAFILAGLSDEQIETTIGILDHILDRVVESASASNFDPVGLED